ncbi:ABC transporter permease [Lentzea alba]|uniref:ABC transporter permease n=1 Tax=Lentzea alba TaxID=2714351 RepID=UPI0028BD82BB|nr:ABC transporter permease [Lentzea alba]
MRALSAYRGELSKLASLPSVWAACLVGVVVPAGVAIINARSTSVDAGFQELAFGVVGVIVLGVVAASSEYFVDGEDNGRQITTSLTVVPSRTRFLLAKIAAVTTVATALAVVAAVITLLLIGQAAGLSRMFGAVVYWVLTALLAFGMTLLTRNGIIPLALLILNTSVVTVTFLLAKITTLAVYFPDMAGIRMFITEVDLPVRLSPVAGGAVMAAWVVALLVAGFATFRRRDA